MSSSSELAAADSYCQALATRHYENFWVAARFLPGATRLHLARVYAYCRTTDDLGDESGAMGTERLGRWRSAVLDLLDGRPPIHPVLIALRPTLARFGIPGDPLLHLIEANLRDQTVAAYGSWEELRSYCMLSAAPVGRMVLRIFEASSPRAERLSDDVCIGLQLANFAQDVSVDALKGRCYLLQPELSGRGTAGATELLCDRAALLLESGRELETMVPGRLRVQVALYRLGGGAVLDAIRAAGYRTDRVRPRVGAAAKIRLLPEALRGARTGPPVEPGAPALREEVR
ncbi:MAG: squalene/phytoene synthase family protein [Candidatus Dormibacteraceae bacterium]